MARKRVRSRKALREEYEAAERSEEEEEDEDELDDEDLDDEDIDDEDLDEDLEDLDEDEEEKPKKKKKKPKKKTTTRKKTSRAAKAQRLRVVWGVFDNSHKLVKKFAYKERKAAEEEAEKLTAAKPSNVHFVQPVREPIEETPEEAKA